jgi:DNA-binding NarL/FixJ family response regulator
MGLALEFSKPARFMKKRVHKETGRFVHSHAARPVPIVTTGVGLATPPPTAPIKDDHDPVRAGLARLFAADAQLRVVSRAEIGLDTVERTLQLTPDSVLVDVWIPTGADGYSPNPTYPGSPMFKVVVLATGFGHDTGDPAQDVAPVGVTSQPPVVSKRELSVLLQVAAGQSNKQIGRLLGISTQTVRNHLSRIFHKLGASNRTEAVMSAMRLGLLVI